ncbi:hypothetical protein [Neorhizobium sp. JUb45]|uniref:hypothetical protein n=1 Tax=Neorhizobium sp. JUb45 TaxID=2485113 RepID=UPI00104B71D2|nr:hypothetical protein [Neorhizobium sp. JUb45]
MLADLVSGKSSKDETETEPKASADEATPPVADANKIVASADASPADVEDAVAASSVPEIVSEPDVAMNPATVDDAGTVTATTPVDELVPFEKKAELASPLKASEEPEKPAARRRVVKAPSPVKAKRPVVAREDEKITLPAVDPVQEAATGFKSHSDEMVDLDRDIEELRKQLAVKLKLQNAHLRKLIDRYVSR